MRDTFCWSQSQRALEVPKDLFDMGKPRMREHHGSATESTQRVYGAPCATLHTLAIDIVPTSRPPENMTTTRPFTLMRPKQLVIDGGGVKDTAKSIIDDPVG